MNLFIINDYLKEVVKNSSYCEKCVFKHYGICFFAYECVKNDFSRFMEKTERDG